MFADFQEVAGVLIDFHFSYLHYSFAIQWLPAQQVRALERFQEVPHEGPITDLMWSDPDADHSGFRISSRGAGFTFGADVVERFCAWNALDCILRAHQLCMQGYQVLFDDKFATVWSAPNYCYRVGNLASVLEIDDRHSKFFNVFAASPVQEHAGGDTSGGGGKMEYFDESD